MVKSMIRDTSFKIKAKFISIQETKYINWSASGMKLFGSNVNDAWIAQNSKGSSGGLVTCWDSDLFHCMGSA